MAKILIVNDSVSVQQILKRIIEAAGHQLVGIANDGFEGIELTKEKNPEIILMDISMPNCDGVEATKQIMEKDPHLILIVTATLRSNMTDIYKCLSYGAVDVVKTPALNGEKVDEKNLLSIGEALLKKIHTILSLKSIINVKGTPSPPKEIKTAQSIRPAELIKGNSARKLIVIGASSGGPNAILHVLKGLPKGFEAGLICLQHIDSSFSKGLADWLDANTDNSLNIYMAKEGDRVINGTGFVSGRSENITVGPDRCIKYNESTKSKIYTPCIDETFLSVAAVYGENAIGVLLTGMGRDGAIGLKAIKDAGGETIAQDQKTSLIYGMPKAAAELGAAKQILPLDKIAGAITTWLKGNV
jgi:two-component system, chemotaxis family, response regulator WspF